MFGLKLRESNYFPPDVPWEKIKNIASASLTPDDFLEEEFIKLVDKANVIYTEKKKKGFWRKKE